MMWLESFTPDDARYALFRTFAEEHYAGDPYWSAPADPTRDLEPLCFLLHDADRVVARACATRIDGEDALRLGWYDCVDRNAVAEALFDGVREHARRLGVSRIIGPINGTTWHRYRLADPSSASPFFLDVHNKTWYVRQWLDAGAEEIASYFSTRFDRLGEYPEHDAHVARQRERGIVLRELALDRFEEEMRLIHAVSLAGFQDNFLYTPIGAEEFIALYRPIYPLLRSELVLIAESESGNAVGFVFAVDNVVERSRRSLVMKSAAVLPEHAGHGLGHLLLETVHRTASEQGYDEIIHALIHRDNRSGRILADRSVPHRTYRLFSLTP